MGESCHHGGWNPGKRARGGKGVGLDYRNHRCRSVWGNMRSATEQHAVLDEHLQKEREANRLRGSCRRGVAQRAGKPNGGNPEE